MRILILKKIWVGCVGVYCGCVVPSWLTQRLQVLSLSCTVTLKAAFGFRLWLTVTVRSPPVNVLMLAPMRPSGVVSCILQVPECTISRLSSALSLAHSWTIGRLSGSWSSWGRAIIPIPMPAPRITKTRLRIIMYLFICYHHSSNRCWILSQGSEHLF